MPLLPFGRQSRPDDGYSASRCLNCFVRGTQDAVSQASLIGRKGMAEFVDLGAPVRAITHFLDEFFAVADGRLWRIRPQGGITDLGSVGGTSENVSFAYNATQLAMVVGNNYYVWDNATSELTPHTPGAVGAPKWCAYLDGYIIVVGNGIGREDAFTVSGLDNAKTFDNLDFAAAESSADQVLGVLADHSELWLFGEESIEIWYNSGGADFPFSRNSSARIERGIISANTIAKEDNSVFWVGDDLVVYRSSGTVPQVISTREVDNVIRASGVHSAFTFDDQSHKFYAVRLNSGHTWCYDLTTLLWSERSTGTEGNAWFATCKTLRDGVQYFGTDTGKIVTWSDNYEDDGAVVTLDAISTLPADADEYAVSRIHARVGNGASLTPSLGRPPEVLMRTSRTVGADWSQGATRPMRADGQYVRPLEWHGIGGFESLSVRFTITDPVNRDIHGVQYDDGQ